jgi:hypothetical protein
MVHPSTSSRSRGLLHVEATKPPVLAAVVFAALLFAALALGGPAPLVHRAVAADGDPFKILAYSPPTGSINISPLIRPWVKLSAEVDPATVTSSTIILRRSDTGTAVPTTFEVLGPPLNRVNIVPAAPLANSATYEAEVTSGVRSSLGEAVTTPWTWTFTVTAATPIQTFVDVPPGATYYEAIQGLADADVVDGKPGPSGFEFQPAAPIWRQQFAKMIVLALDLYVDESMTSPFTDLDADSPSSLYPNEYVAAVSANGITTGITATTFGPYRDITRAQVITMCVRALENLHSGALMTPPPTYSNTWGTGFSGIHGPTARTAEYNGLLAGLGVDAAHPLGNLAALDPWGVMPRGEVAQVVWNLMELLGTQP